jgi:5-(carboxyamino)imidazole ribonucleotide synthase
MNIIKPGGTLGILGGGQLGKMTLQAAHQLGYHTVVLAPPGDNPAMEMATHRIEAAFSDRTALAQFFALADVVTTEWENIPVTLLQAIEKAGKPVRPGSKVLKIAQSRSAEKSFASMYGIPTTPTIFLREGDSVPAIETPCILKTDRLGYDGKGQWRVETKQALAKAFAKAAVDCVLEEVVPIYYEVSVLVARTSDDMSVSNVVVNTHKNGILDTTSWLPNEVPGVVAVVVQQYAEEMARRLNLFGICVFEFFITKEKKVLFNEMAPRPHNSFHGSIEAARTSQFEQHVRAVCGLPLGEVKFHTAFKMTNLIGDDVVWWEKYLTQPNTRLHLYGKQETRAGRKMGHVTELLYPRK